MGVTAGQGGAEAPCRGVEWPCFPPSEFGGRGWVEALGELARDELRGLDGWRVAVCSQRVSCAGEQAGGGCARW